MAKEEAEVDWAKEKDLNDADSAAQPASDNDDDGDDGDDGDDNSLIEFDVLRCCTALMSQSLKRKLQ